MRADVSCRLTSQPTMVARKGVIPKIYLKQPTSYANRICL
ncbi:hypothetical protein vBPaerPsCh_137c [Pseudomonas phage vB_Paer_PsCh]|uniref:Uncharacterized protein n=1 Tax=Pseudomonas phage vB_Paer_PsCh TaxID=2924906 RepID=A0A9Y1G1H6_9CAUD|nr:hypothetical protein QE349_gp137 [Pseudomonas phage vB_Paer_PsCh]UOL47968.1 hypothetical protein vBPaerPsCh_137c [Pseudomonas phage vB_Paer_PsCh]